LYYEVRGSAKMDVMTRLIDLHNLKLSVVFCNTKKKVDEVVEQLIANGYKAEGIHGDLRQNQRNNVMGKFRNGQVNILVATDVAARGIDVDNVEAVINYDLPLDDEYYVHRIGRTGRAGKTGKAFTLVSGKDSARLREIQHYTKVRMTRGVLPSNEEMAEHRKIKLITKIRTILETKNVQQFETMLGDIEKEGLDLNKVAAALLFMEIGEKEIVRTENKFATEGREGRGDRDSRESRGSFGRDRNSRGDRNDRGDRGDRGDRFGDRNDKPKREKRSRISNSEMVRLFINVGKMDKVGPGDIVGAIAGETGIAGDSIGSIDIYDKYSFVEIPKESLNEVLEGMNDNTIKGRKVSIEVAN
jgi:ATP-dependent RNA helicase DeaD